MQYLTIAKFLLFRDWNTTIQAQFSSYTNVALRVGPSNPHTANANLQLAFRLVYYKIRTRTKFYNTEVIKEHRQSLEFLTDIISRAFFLPRSDPSGSVVRASNQYNLKQKKHRKGAFWFNGVSIEAFFEPFREMNIEGLYAIALQIQDFFDRHPHMKRDLY